MSTINTIKTALHMMRQEYAFPAFTRTELTDNPWLLFHQWFALAQKKELEANAMVLATASADGQPRARVVLLKEVSEGGLVFFGHLHSQKMRDISENPKASLLFYWEKQKRQVRFGGTCHKISDRSADEYFATRPYGSQIGAWASEQSAILPDRETLESKVADYTKKFPHGAVPRPPLWSGYRLIPHEVEFWQGRMSRLHDRFVYRQTQGGWDISQLYP